MQPGSIEDNGTNPQLLQLFEMRDVLECLDEVVSNVNRMQISLHLRPLALKRHARQEQGKSMLTFLSNPSSFLIPL